MPSWIYQITQNSDNKIIYIGSTTGKYFCLRKGEHTRPSTMKARGDMKLYTHIRENGGWSCFKFEIIEEREPMSKEDLRSLEKRYIQERTPLCNVISPIETHEEMLARRKEQSRRWRKEHPEYLEQMKQRQSQIEYIKKRCSTKVSCECGGTYTLQNKTNHFSRNIHKEYENKKIKTENIESVTSPQQEV